MNATDPYVSVIQFGKLYRWFKFWVCRDEVVTYDYLSESYCPCGTIVYLKSGSNFRVCVKFQNVAIKFKFTEIET